ncbi:uncharacterized protein LOC132562224 [Ylistrum balloti]|uniref:uncharacterized protein LOC132562224 n=1 Tax=Ylistrum balloti TaxID=509963 RepID=UPI0029059328|nr:uncharacterized protein LOC132562224 [Ylistrum balloti]
MTGVGAMNPFAAQTQMNNAGFQSVSSSSSLTSASSGNNTNSNPLSGPSGMPNPFNPQASAGQQSTAGYSGQANPAGNPMQSGNPMNMNPFGSSSNVSSNSTSQSMTNSPSNMNPFGASQMASVGFSSTFDPNKINGMLFSSLVGRRTLVKRQSSGGSSSIPNYDPNAVNQLTSSFLDPSKSKLGAGGATGGMYNPDQWNTISFNMFNPQSQLGRRRLTRQATIPNYDPNAVNQLTSSFLDPSTSKLGAGGATGGMYNPDQWNTISFNMFDPQSQLGRRYIKRQTAQGPSMSGTSSPAAVPSSGGSSSSGSSQTSGSSATGGSSQPGGASQTSGSSQPGGASQTGGSSQPGGASQTGGSSQTSGASQMTQPGMFTNPGAFTMGGGSPSSAMSSGSSGGSSSSGSGSSGSSSSSSIPSFDPNKLNQIQVSFLDPSKAQLGQGGGGGSGFNPDQINSQVFNFFNPNLMMGGGGR